MSITVTTWHLSPMPVEFFAKSTTGEEPPVFTLCGDAASATTMYLNQKPLCERCLVVWDQVLQLGLVQVGTVTAAEPMPVAIWNKGVWLGGRVTPDLRPWMTTNLRQAGELGRAIMHWTVPPGQPIPRLR